MQSLRQHEVFEIEVLEKLHKGGFLKSLIFGGGTMLRLCHELPRYSVDLDFWFSKPQSYPLFYKKLLEFLSASYALSDSKNKYFTLLYEFRGKTSDRKLKIEIRKEVIKEGAEQKIAFSPFASKQVLVQALSLEAMARRKIQAALNRHELRDYFDLEFLLRKGVKLQLSEKERSLLEKRAHSFRRSDFSSVLGGLLEKDLREYYAKNGFSYLLESLRAVDLKKSRKR